MIINKQYLNQFKTLDLYFNSDWEFKIPVEEIAEIYCENTGDEFETGQECFAWDGYIKITPKGGAVLSEETIEPNESCSLKARVVDYFDLTSFALATQHGLKEEYGLPYDPLIESLHGSEVELSNCPSAEIDENGYILIGFGAHSKSPKRKDNNFEELIEGWKNSFGDYAPDVLKVKLNCLSNFTENDFTDGLLFDFDILNKRAKHKSLFLICADCSKLAFKIHPHAGTMELNLSRLENGNIFVDLVGYDFTFECKSVRIDDNAFYYLYDYFDY